jgi:hypothetical protein
MHRTPTGPELARREAAWKTAICDAEERARRRLDEVCDRLALDRSLRRPIVRAAMEVARDFAIESMYANYEHRTGTPWPGEWRELHDEEREAAWRSTLESLTEVLPRTVHRT